MNEQLNHTDSLYLCELTVDMLGIMASTGRSLPNVVVSGTHLLHGYITYNDLIVCPALTHCNSTCHTKMVDQTMVS